MSISELLYNLLVDVGDIHVPSPFFFTWYQKSILGVGSSWYLVASYFGVYSPMNETFCVYTNTILELLFLKKYVSTILSVPIHTTLTTYY